MLIIFGAILILVGLATIIVPEQWAAMGGIGVISAYERWLLAILGAGFFAVGVWVIVAGRDPLRHISWSSLSY